MSTSVIANDTLPVFYIEPVGGHRGMHYYNSELCQALQSVGVDVTLMTCDETKNSIFPPSFREEFPFQGIYGNTSKIVRGFRYLRGLMKISRAMQRQDIPLAHFHYFHYPPLDYFYLKWLHRIGKRCVLTAHDVISFDAKTSSLPWLQRIYHEADRIIVHAENNSDIIVQTFEVNPGKVQVIPMGPYLGFAKGKSVPASSARKRLGLEGDKQVILFFGQIKKVKGLQHLIYAFRQVAKQYPATRLVIAGPEWKESFRGYAALIRELNLTHKVLTRIEYIPDEEVGLYFSAADVVVLPYTEVYQSAVLYMAYSFARPVVASSVGGLAEVVENGVTGLLVPPANIHELAHALSTLLQNREMARSMGEKGRALVEKKFSWAEIARRTAVVYAEVLSRANKE